MERPSAEARLGLPELAGVWRFAGWEIVRGDSTMLERTFPSFGRLEVEVQRLDSIAGVFELGDEAVPVVGEVRRGGRVALVTIVGGTPANFLAGEHNRDTLWLELTSILPAAEWPREARAAFVREVPSGPLAWIRGATRAVTPDPVELRDEPDSPISLPPQPAPGLPGDSPPAAAPSAVTPPAPEPVPAPPVQMPPTETPPAQAPPAEVPPPPPPPADVPAPAEPDPDPEPEPEPEPEPPGPPPLLGEPIDRGN